MACFPGSCTLDVDLALIHNQNDFFQQKFRNLNANHTIQQSA